MTSYNGSFLTLTLTRFDDYYKLIIPGRIETTVLVCAWAHAIGLLIVKFLL